MARILVAGFCAVPGPHRAGVQIPHVLRALSSRHKVEVLTVRRGDQAYVEQYRKTRMLRVPVPDGPALEQIEAYRRALRRQLEGAEYDVVHFRDGWAGQPVMQLRDRLKLRTVFDIARGPMAQAPIGDEKLAGQLATDEAVCVRGADLILAPTEAAARYLSSKGAGDRVRLVPPGVDVDTFDWDHAPAYGARVLYAGMLRRGRGIRTLLRAMVEVASRTDARLSLIGPLDPGFAGQLRDEIEQYGLADRVDLPGTVDNEDMPAAIAEATICVAPMALELARQPTALYPTKLLEYMACRRVVVAPRRGTVTMLVTDNEHGLLFKPGDATDLAAQILRLLADPQLRDRLARAAYERVRSQNTASATRRELMVAYDPVVADLPESEDTGPRMVSRVHERDGDETAEVTDSHFPAVATSGEIRAASSDTATDGGFDEPTIITNSPPGGDMTNVEVGGPEDSLTDEHALATAEQWVVAAGPVPGADGEDDDAEDEERDTAAAARPVKRAETAPNLKENRFVAGELEVPPASSPPDDDVFEAAGTLLGSGVHEASTGEVIPPDTGESSSAPDNE